MLEEQVHGINEHLRSMDGLLEDQVRVILGLGRVVAYFRAAEVQRQRVVRSLCEPSEGTVPPRFPLDEATALCETHFFLICWDSIYKVIENLKDTAYGFDAPAATLSRHRDLLMRYRVARHHLEHLPERYPGQKHTDWSGDANSITGTVAGVRRDGFFVFQGQEWDVTEKGIAQLSAIVGDFVSGMAGEVAERFRDFPDRSAMWRDHR